MSQSWVIEVRMGKKRQGFKWELQWMKEMEKMENKIAFMVEGKGYTEN